VIFLSIPQPQGLKFVQWGAIVAEQLAGYGIQAPANEEAWQEWGASLLHEPKLGVAPSPIGFNDWQDWASSFKATFA
jgi:hypothetical protein